MRRAAVAMMLCMLCGAALYAAEPTRAETEVWVKSLRPLPEDGWEPLAMAAGVFVYVSLRDAHRQGTTASAWTRYEYLQSFPWMGYFAAKSIVRRVEVDCARKIIRDISSDGYAGNNLSGDHKSWVADKPSLWTPVVPGTSGEDVAAEFCARTKPRAARPTAVP